MALAYAGAGTVVTSSGVNPVLAPVAPASGVNHRNYLIITWKDGTIAEPVVSASVGTWKKLTAQLQTGVVTGLDVGSPNVNVYYADGNAPTTNTVTFTGTVGACQAAIFNFTKGASEYFFHDFASGNDSTNGADISVTTGALTTDSTGFVIACSSVNTDGGTPSAVAITNTTTVTNRIDSISTTGDDSRLSVYTAVPTTTESAVRTFSYTNASSSSAATILINLKLSSLQHNNTSTPVNGTGTNLILSPDVATPSGANYRNFLFVIWKSSTAAEPVVDAGTGEWIRITSSANTTPIASGPNVGSMKGILYYADGTCPTGTTVVFSETVGCAQAVTTNFVNSDGTKVIGHNYANGEDDTIGANYSATATAIFNAAAVEDDVLVTFTGFNTDDGTPTVPTMTATGITIGAAADHLNIGTATGDDTRIMMSSAGVSNGSQLSPVTYSHTNASSGKGISIFIKLKLLASPVVAVVPQPSFYLDPGFNVTATGMAEFDYFEVLRGDAAGHPVAAVRQGQYQAVLDDEFDVVDYEFSFGSTGRLVPSNPLIYTFNFYYLNQLSYVTIVSTANPMASYTASIDAAALGIPDGAFPKTYLSVPKVPELNMSVMISEFQDATSDGNILSESHVLGRRNPVVNTDVSSGMTGSFKLLVTTGIGNSSQSVPTNVKVYTDAFGTGNVFMLRNVSPLVAGFEDFYFVVKSYKVRRENVIANQVSMVEQNRIDPNGTIGDAYRPTITIEVGFTETDAPANSHVSQLFTWQTLLDSFTSWQDVLDTFPDWLSVLQVTDGRFDD